MNIVVLERTSVGTDIDVSFDDLGTVTYYDEKGTEEETRERIREAEVVVLNKSSMTKEVLREANNLKLLCEFATGFDNIDIDYCREKGIRVANVVNYSTASVAQHTFALALYLYEKLPFYDRYVKSGAYAAQSNFSYFDVPFGELDGKTWGIVGMGHIGQRVAQIARAFGCRVIFYSVTGKSQVTAYEQVDFDTLLAESDFLSLHCPLSPLTRYLIDGTALHKMKPSAILINMARGPVVNTQDLYEALTQNVIAAAGLDVLEKEPMEKDNPLGLILDSQKLVITPHVAWATVEARKRCVAEVRANIEAYQEGRIRNVVNLE